MTLGEEEGGEDLETAPRGRADGRGYPIAVGGPGLYVLMRMYHIVYQRLAMVIEKSPQRKIASFGLM